MYASMFDITALAAASEVHIPRAIWQQWSVRWCLVHSIVVTAVQVGVAESSLRMRGTYCSTIKSPKTHI